jgi:hypothetical protein
MTMGKARGISGGGIEGRNVSETRNLKAEPVSHPVSMNRPSMIGASTHFVKPPLYSSSVKATTPIGATPSVAGVGGGRMILKSGSQGKHGPDRPMPKGRDLFR